MNINNMTDSEVSEVLKNIKDKLEAKENLFIKGLLSD